MILLLDTSAARVYWSSPVGTFEVSALLMSKAYPTLEPVVALEGRPQAVRVCKS